MTAALTPPDAGESRRSRIDRKLCLMVLLGTLVGLEFLENGMFVFAASHIVGGVDAAPREFAQVQAAYAVGSMLMIVMQQSLSRHFGYRHYLCGALALFMVGALASAAAQGLLALTLARLLQGFGGGALFTSARVLVPMLFAPAERPRALKYFMLILFSLSACAPVLAASLVDGIGWRWIFIGVLPLAALTLAACAWLLPPDVGRGARPERWAAVPLLLVATALTLTQLALSQARYDLFAHPLQLAALGGGGAALLTAFAVHQWHHEAPLLRLREMSHPAYLTGLLLYFLHYLLSNASGYVFPIFAERSLGLPLLTAGWLSSFAAAVSLAGAFVYMKVSRRIANKKPLMATGALMLVLSAALFASMPPQAPAGALMAALVAKGLFGVLLVLPVAGLTFRDLGEARFAHGYQSKNLMRQLAGSFSSAIAAIVLQDRQFANAAQIAASVTLARPEVGGWLDQVQAGYRALGLAPEQARAATLATLQRLIDQQATLMSCEDVYRMLALLAGVTAAAVLLQRQLK